VPGNWRITFDVAHNQIHHLDGRITAARAADVLGVRRATLSGLVNGKASLSPEMALRIAKAFSVSMDTLLHMQAWYDSYTMRAHAGEMHVNGYEPA
jgi:addiction module HigA family antidote